MIAISLRLLVSKKKGLSISGRFLTVFDFKHTLRLSDTLWNLFQFISDTMADIRDSKPILAAIAIDHQHRLALDRWSNASVSCWNVGEDGRQDIKYAT